MATSEISEKTHQLETLNIKNNLLKECRVMITYALANGKQLNPGQIAPLHKEDKDITSAELVPVHNYLVNAVKPAVPGTLVLFDKNKQSDKRFKFLGPLPIVRQFMLLSVASLLALMLVSLSEDVNAYTIQLSMLQGHGTDQLLRLIFLLSCASVGASFYVLFKMNSYISSGTFDMKHSATYWARYVLGLIAGLMLSELFVAFIDSGDAGKAVSQGDGASEEVILSSATYLLKPVLAILGGFSASLVYRIMNRLREAVGSIFKVSSTEAVKQVEQKLTVEAQEQEHQIKANLTNQVLHLKNNLIKEGGSEEAIEHVNQTINQLTGKHPQE